MDNNNGLLWATGINNTQLKQDVIRTEAIFKKLSLTVNTHLQSISNKYAKMLKSGSANSSQKSTERLKKQLQSLGKVIDTESGKLKKMATTYDASMNSIAKKTSSLGEGIPAKSPLHSVVKSIKRDTEKAQQSIEFLKRRYMYAVGSMIAYGSIHMFKNLSSSIVHVKGVFDQIEVSMESFVGSAHETSVVMDELTELAVKSPFQLIDITDSAKQLLAYGEDAKSVTETIKKLSDVSAGSGQSIRDIAYLYGTSLTQGRLYARDLFQFANRGVPIYEALAATMKDFNGETGISTERLKSMVSTGKVGFDQLKVAIDYLTMAGGKYANLSDKLAETTYGKISNLEDKWTMALKSIGDSTNGVINSMVDLTTYAIENWQDLAKAIAIALELVAANQVAKMMTGAALIQKSKVKNEAEIKVLKELIIAETEESGAKEKETYAASKYTLSLRNELKQMAKNLAVKINLQQQSLQATTEKIAALNAEIALEQKALVSKKSKLTADEIEITKNNINTMTTEVNTLSKKKNATAENISALSTRRSTIIKGMDTAINTANTASTNILTVAKLKLTAATRALYTTMAANPLTAALLALTSIVFIIQVLKDRTTAATKAKDDLADAIGGVNDELDKEKAKVQDRLSLALNDKEVDIARVRNFNELKKLYPDILKNIDLENLSRAKALEIQKKINEEIEKERGLKLKTKVEEAKKDYEEKQVNYDKTVKIYENLRGGLGISKRRETKKAKTALDAAKMVYEGLSEEYAKYLKDLDDAKKLKDKGDAIKDKAYWENRKKEAIGAIDGIESKYLKVLKGGGDTAAVPEKILKDYKKAVKKLKDAEKELEVYGDEKKNIKKNKRGERFKTLTDDINNNDKKLKEFGVRATIENDKAIAESKEDGYLKQKERQKVKHQEELARIKKYHNKILALERKNARDRYKLEHPDWKDADLPDVTSLSPKSQGTIDTFTEAANRRNRAANRKLLEDRLDDFKDFNTQKLAIKKKYEDDITAFQNARVKAVASGDTEMISKLDNAIKEAGKKYKESIAKVDFHKLQKNMDWGSVFSNLNKLSTESLKDLSAQLEDFAEKSNDSLSKVDTKAISQAMDKINKEMISRVPFKSMATYYKKYKTNIKALTKERKKLNIMKEKEVEGSEAVTKQEGKVRDLENERHEIMEGLKSSMIEMSGISEIISEGLSKVLAKLGKSKSALIVIIALVVELVSYMFREARRKLDAHLKWWEDHVSTYTSIMDTIISKHAELMKEMSGKGAIEASKNLIKQIHDEIEAYRQLAKEEAKYREKHEHSRRYKTNRDLGIAENELRMKHFTDDEGNIDWEAYHDSYMTDSYDPIRELWKKLFPDRDPKDQNITIDDIMELTPEELEKLKNEAPEIWAAIDENIRENLDKQIELYNKEKEYLKLANEKLTSLNLDDAKKTFDKMLLDSPDNISEALAKDFKDKLKNAMLGVLKDRYLNKAMADWYQMLVDAMGEDSKSGEEVTEEEARTLKEKYDSIYKNAKDRYDKLVDAMNLDDEVDDKNSTETAIKSMNQASADILTAQFSALRIHGSNIDTTTKYNMAQIGEIMNIQRDSYILVDIMSKDISKIKDNTERLQTMEKYLHSMSSNGIKMI